MANCVERRPLGARVSSESAVTRRDAGRSAGPYHSLLADSLASLIVPRLLWPPSAAISPISACLLRSPSYGHMLALGNGHIPSICSVAGSASADGADEFDTGAATPAATPNSY